MGQKLNIIIEITDENSTCIHRELVHTKDVVTASSLLELGYRHQEQIEVLQLIQDALLSEQSSTLGEPFIECPSCHSKVRNKGAVASDFHSVFTDHKVKIRRQYCSQCNWKNIPSVYSLFGTAVHPDLSKLQCEAGAKSTYRDASNELNKLSNGSRRINNHVRINQTCDKIGDHIAANPTKVSNNIITSNELCVQVDGGHVKSKEVDERSFEVMTSVAFNPKNIAYTYGYEKNVDVDPAVVYQRGKLLSKHCAASSLSDKLSSIKSLTLEAAKKEGLSQTTDVTALCDGANNCWQVVDHLRPYCQSILCVLDWFHVGMKFQNLSLDSDEIAASAKNAKWHLWRGDVDKAIERLEAMKILVDDKKEKKKLSTLINYFDNNRHAIINYSERHEKGLCISSQLAESNVESLINQRCKGKQHMRWTREGLHPLMQIRATIASNDWSENWETIVCGATLKQAG